MAAIRIFCAKAFGAFCVLVDDPANLAMFYSVLTEAIDIASFLPYPFSAIFKHCGDLVFHVALLLWEIHEKKKLRDTLIRLHEHASRDVEFGGPAAETNENVW